MFVQWKLYLMLGAAAVIAASSFTMGIKWEKSAYEQLKAADAKAAKKAQDDVIAEQKRLNEVSIASAKKELAVQASIAAGLKVQLSKVRKHVHDLERSRPGCITLGFVRVLDAAARGIDPDTLVLPAGKSDDTCAPVGAAAVARSIVDNYGTDRANGAQLDALIDGFRASRK